MAAFLSLGLLEQISTFVEKDISKELLIDNCYISDAYDKSCYRELIDPLTKIGRQDLVDGIDRIIKRYHERDFIGLVKRLDRTFFKDNLSNISQKIKKSNN